MFDSLEPLRRGRPEANEGEGAFYDVGGTSVETPERRLTPGGPVQSVECLSDTNRNRDRPLVV